MTTNTLYNSSQFTSLHQTHIKENVHKKKILPWTNICNVDNKIDFTYCLQDIIVYPLHHSPTYYKLYNFKFLWSNYSKLYISSK
jgi:hypothetical protein